ncbi:MAG: glutathione S-transferase family protein [Deltaproteobacteria bacterium]|nr:glutathione S-transferase family protein [Deltaproteobacteria bacterium]
MGTEQKIQLYDFASSPNCQRVKIVLEEKKIPYQTIPVDLKKGDQKKADFLKLNPYGKVPVIVDANTVLYESCIINEYLEEKYPEPSLMPKDPGRRAKIRILIDYGLNHFDSPYQRLRQELMKEEKERSVEAVENAKKDIKTLLQRFERDIGDLTYLAGDFSLLDAALIPRFLRLEGFGVLPDSSLPRLSRWLERVKGRPSVRAIM